MTNVIQFPYPAPPEDGVEHLTWEVGYNVRCLAELMENRNQYSKYVNLKKDIHNTILELERIKMVLEMVEEDNGVG